MSLFRLEHGTNLFQHLQEIIHADIVGMFMEDLNKAAHVRPLKVVR